MQIPVGTPDGGSPDVPSAIGVSVRPPGVPEPQRAARRSSAGRISLVGARSRLEDELRAIAVDLLGPNESDELPASCTTWVASVTRAAVSKACERALDTLIRELDSRLADVPPDVVQQLRRARLRQEVGFA